MVRSAKEDLSSLIPPVTHTVVMLDFEAEHAKSYNSLVDVIRRNLLLADWFDPAHKESLLHSSQLKYQRQTLRQLQLSTCVAGHINIQPTDSDIRETIQVGVAYIIKAQGSLDGLLIWLSSSCRPSSSFSISTLPLVAS